MKGTSAGKSMESCGKNKGLPIVSCRLKTLKNLLMYVCCVYTSTIDPDILIILEDSCIYMP